jgi:hypothetical protein
MGSDDPGAMVRKDEWGRRNDEGQSVWCEVERDDTELDSDVGGDGW